MKCECGEIFVGSSTPEPPAQAGGPPDSPLGYLPMQALSRPQFRPPARRRYNPAMLAGTLVLTLAVLVGVGLAVYYKQQHPKVLVREDWKTRQATPEEVARYLAKPGPAAAKQPGPAGPEQPDSTPGAETPPGATRSAATPATASAPAPPESDSRVDLGSPLVKTSDLDAASTYFVGTITNLTDRPLAKLTIRPLVDGQPVADANGAVLEQSYEYIPPRGKGSVRYCIELQGQIDAAQVTLVARATPAPENMLVWDASQNIQASQVDEDGAMKVSGFVKNVNDTPVGPVEIYCDCYDADGILVGNGHGKAGAEGVGINKSAAFNFKVNGKGLFAAKQVQARAVARRS
jgi:hypothetical protein